MATSAARNARSQFLCCEIYTILTSMPLAHRRTVSIGLLGTTLDRGTGPNRWEAWRPSVALCQHEDLLIDRFELIYAQRFALLAETVRADITRVSPETEVRLCQVDVRDPWDFEDVYGALHDFARAYPFDPDAEDYLVHITTGTHVAQICLFLLTESRHLPGAAGADQPAAARSPCRGPRHVSHHRSRPVEVRPHRLALRARDGGPDGAAEVGHRDAQPGVQRAHRADRAGGRRARRRRSCSSAPPGRASRCSRGGSTS